MLGQKERPFQLHVHQQIELLRGGFAEQRMHADPGVVDQEIKALTLKGLPQYLFNLRGKRGEILAAADVQLQHRRFRAERLQFSDQRLGLVGAAVVGADDVDALRGKVHGGAAAQATTGASDQCDFAIHADFLDCVEW